MANATSSAWSGGQSPFAMDSKKTGMWLFLLSDSLTFSALLIAYSYVRLSNDWPRPFHVSSIVLSSIMTLILLSSSVTMVLAVNAAAKGKRKRSVQWIGATMLGGVLFIILHTWEWLGMIHEGVTPFDNPWGVPLFGATFFALTGLHMTHVLLGVLYLGTIAWGFGTSRFTAVDVEVSGLYWHFVDLVWMFIFPMVYLLSNVVSH